MPSRARRATIPQSGHMSASVSAIDLIGTMPQDVFVAALSLWPADVIACTAATCQECYELLDQVVAMALLRLGYKRLPPPKCASDTRTHRLRFLQRLAVRRPKTLCAGSTSSLCIVGQRTVLAWGSDDTQIFTLPSPVAGPPADVAIHEIAAGDSHCLLLAVRV